MAKSFNKSNVVVTQQSAKVGNVRFYQRKGETYIRSAHNAVKSNPRTDKQMHQRLQFVSRAVIWRALKDKLKKAFTTKVGNQSDYNVFTMLNNGKGVYFTKQQAAKGAQVIFPVQISDGSLPSIVTSMNRGQLKTNIALASLVLDANTTIGEFANAVVAGNEDFNFGDVLIFVSVLQTVNGEGIPKIKGEFSGVKLIKGDRRKVLNVVPAEAFQNVDGCLGTAPNLPVGCFAYLHTRSNSKLDVSSQTLVSNNELLIAQYTSEEQYLLARDSYGKANELFLSQGSNPVVDETEKK